MQIINKLAKEKKYCEFVIVWVRFCGEGSQRVVRPLGVHEVTRDWSLLQALTQTRTHVRIVNSMIICCFVFQMHYYVSCE